MATIQWRGDAVAVAQVSTVTVTADDATTTYSIAINGKKVSVLGTGVSAAATASALQVALAASTIPEFLEVAWTYPGSGAVVTGTANISGVTFTATSSVSGGAGTIGAVSTTAGAGPNDLNIAANYSGGVLPANGDDLYFTNSTSPALYNLGSLSGVTLNSLNLDPTYTGTIGLPRYNASGGYLEYRATYLAIGATTFNVFASTGNGAGSRRVKVNFGSVQTTANVLSTGSPADQGLPALILKGTHASNVLNVQQGNVGVAIEPGDVSTFATVRIGYQQSQGTDVTLTMGSGVTLTTVNQYGGTSNVNSSITTALNYGGTLNVYGTAAVTTMTVEKGGSVAWESSGTLTTGIIGVGCTLDYSADPRAKTATTLTVYGTLLDPAKVVTYTNPVSFPSGIGGKGGAALDWGANYSLQRS